MAGRDPPLPIPVHEFLYHGVSDWHLRTLSHGKFVSVVPTASVAEPVLVAQFLKVIREGMYDIDAVATHVLTTMKPGVDVPNKSSDAPTLFKPIVCQLAKIFEQNSTQIHDLKFAA